MAWGFCQIQAWSFFSEFLTPLFPSFKLVAHYQQLCYMTPWSTLIGAVLRCLAKSSFFMFFTNWVYFLFVIRPFDCISRLIFCIYNFLNSNCFLFSILTIMPILYIWICLGFSLFAILEHHCSFIKEGDGGINLPKERKEGYGGGNE